jgi:DNA-binding MarR family transcriptional regulator
MVEESTRELGARLSDVERSLRLLKQQWTGAGPTGHPVGSIGLLRHIDDASTGCHGRELSVRTGLDPSTISRAVAALVAAGLVERRADPSDGRASVLALTTAGREALTGAHLWVGEVLDRALSGWTPDEVAALSSALGRFADDIARSTRHPDIRHTDIRHTDTLEAAR